MKSAPAIAFDYRPSRWLVIALIGVALLAVAAIAFCGLALWIKALLIFAACGYAAWSLRSLLRPPFDRVVWHAAGHWRVRDRAGDERAAEFVHATVRGRWIVLVLRVGPKLRIALPLFADNCDGETHRQLRIRLATTNPM
jgi:toxin CptA